MHPKLKTPAPLLVNEATSPLTSVMRCILLLFNSVFQDTSELSVAAGVEKVLVPKECRCTLSLISMI